MRHPWFALAVVVAAIAMAGCGGTRARCDSGTTTASDAPTLRFVEHRFADSTGACDTERAACARITLRWPSAIGGATADSLNTWILAHVMAGTGDAGAPVRGAPESLAASFLGGYRDFRRHWPDAPQQWVLERTATVLLDTLGVVTLHATEESFTGGAHGMHVARSASFSKADGHRYRWRDLVASPHDSAFAALGERVFRATREVAPGQSLADAGFFGEGGGHFEFGDDVAITRAGLAVHWDPYEIAPYAWGPTTITIGWSELAPFARADGPLARWQR